MRALFVLKVVGCISLSAIFLISYEAVEADFCKWVDEHGVTHYAESCPDGVESKKIEIRPPPTEHQDSEIQDDWAEEWLRQQSKKREEERSKRMYGGQEAEDCANARAILSRLESDCPVFYDQQGTIFKVCPQDSPVLVYGKSIKARERAQLADYYRARIANCN